MDTEIYAQISARHDLLNQFAREEFVNGAAVIGGLGFIVLANLAMLENITTPAGTTTANHLSASVVDLARLPMSIADMVGYCADLLRLPPSELSKVSWPELAPTLAHMIAHNTLHIEPATTDTFLSASSSLLSLITANSVIARRRARKKLRNLELQTEHDTAVTPTEIKFTEDTRRQLKQKHIKRNTKNLMAIIDGTVSLFDVIRRTSSDRHEDDRIVHDIYGNKLKRADLFKFSTTDPKKVHEALVLTDKEYGICSTEELQAFWDSLSQRELPQGASYDLLNLEEWCQVLTGLEEGPFQNFVHYLLNKKQTLVTMSKVNDDFICLEPSRDDSNNVFFTVLQIDLNYIKGGNYIVIPVIRAGDYDPLPKKDTIPKRLLRSIVKSISP